ncbi:MAG: tRNA epoxyqueuosine(34) reductase QueG [Betaproteobacteria bacterium]|nr:tRNA epoxyqueuosine(34) reductase QueG [Betaproteobacteria bacterium]
MKPDHPLPLEDIKDDLVTQARALGFSAVSVSKPALAEASDRLEGWVAEGYHGDMGYLARHAELRRNPAALQPGTVRVVSVTLPYLASAPETAEAALADRTRGYVSRYALGRDYHKVLRSRLQELATRLEARWGSFNYRVFTDSAPVLEVEIARQGGLGWRGKHTLLLRRDAGSLFFLGELFIDLPLPADDPEEEDHCGTCQACIDICPTQAILGPYRLDARRCISYLTIEHQGSIPEPLRPLLGNRIYGCDDCQLACPWNRFARLAAVPDFAPRPPLEAGQLETLFSWEVAEFEAQLAGSAIRRIGHERWLRNIAVALGNGPDTPSARAALARRQNHPSALVREHVNWALARLSE